MSREVVGILLAAGSSTRFGGNKLLQKLPGTDIPIAVQSARHMMEAIPNSIAIVREDDPELWENLSRTGIRIVFNTHAHLGISSSIRCGIKQCSNAFAWIISLADMPYISPEIIKQVANTLQRGALIAAPEYNGQRGHPVGFSHELKKELLNLRADVGAKTVIDNHPDDVRLFQVKDNSILRDIDQADDLRL